MSRVLADLLGSDQMAFRLQLQQLERAAGAPSADVRLSAHILQTTREKLKKLSLDPQDTHGPELYRALQVKLTQDEALIRQMLQVSEATSGEVLAAATVLIAKELKDVEVFAVKNTVLRNLLKKLKPKATMKALGYRSMDSMFKHENVAHILTATLVTEPAQWHEHRLQAYGGLRAQDFEMREISFTMPKTTKKWPEIAKQYATKYRHTMSTLNELGAVVILPVEEGLPGLAITTIALGMSAANEIRSRSAYLKLQQVRPDFGAAVTEIMQHEPMTDAEIAGQQLPWKVVHWFYSKGLAAYHPEAFEPHVQPSDLVWHDTEGVLGRIHSALEFWEGTAFLGLLDGAEAVSLNILDVALGLCNGLTYNDRVVRHMREALGRELLARYLHQENLQSIVAASLSTQLVADVDFA